VRQRPHPGDVADRPQPFAGGHAGVDGDAVRARVDDDRVEPEAVEPGAPARGDEQAVAAQLRGVGEVEHVLLAVAAGRAGVLPEVQHDAVGGQRLADRLAERSRLARKHVIAALHERDGRAQPRHRLGHLDADRPGAEHEQSARDLRETGRLAARPHAREPAQPGNGRDHRVRARGDDDVLGRVGLRADRDGVRTGEAPLPAQHLDPRARAHASWPASS
jgi:hypothetical protein